ncbi:metallophosphoesterase [Jeotgalibacillus salarius]|uniref:Metallophosphoesterase n=1 Tax=Jeotgalibacillus salarius TaxID=546023 RepID=A0A4Y8LJK3_9BACL|nr:metallophosphoesterase [Jeotgalibacillus salarius]TFE03108.1 metallophosphoesterase [Jeotgalibacillus salarius]
MKYVYTAAGFFIAIGLLMIKRAFENNLVTHKIKICEEPLKQPLKVLFISDIHRRKISAQWFSSLPEVDIVLIGGDITERGVPYERVRHNAALLSHAGKAYFVFGNNDEEVNKNKLTSILEKEGIVVLENDSIEIESHQHISIAGVGDVNYQQDNLNLALNDIKGENIILLSHDPRITRKLTNVSEASKVRVVLSGHTHGGQIRFFGFGPYDKGGLVHHHQFSQLISNGYGTTLIPMRLGAKSEIHLIHFI